ncbi:MAG: hypothetical protein ACK4ZN_08825 [Oceanibaculum sp.]
MIAPANERGCFVVVEGQLGRDAQGRISFDQVRLEGGALQVIGSRQEAERVANDLSNRHRTKTFLVAELVAYAVDRSGGR